MPALLACHAFALGERGDARDGVRIERNSDGKEIARNLHCIRDAHRYRLLVQRAAEMTCAQDFYVLNRRLEVVRIISVNAFMAANDRICAYQRDTIKAHLLILPIVPRGLRVFDGQMIQRAFVPGFNCLVTNLWQAKVFVALIVVNFRVNNP